jgi:hypothetical protein
MAVMAVDVLSKRVHLGGVRYIFWSGFVGLDGKILST